MTMPSIGNNNFRNLASVNANNSRDKSFNVRESKNFVETLNLFEAVAKSGKNDSIYISKNGHIHTQGTLKRELGTLNSTHSKTCAVFKKAVLDCLAQMQDEVKKSGNDPSLLRFIKQISQDASKIGDYNVKGGTFYLKKADVLNVMSSLKDLTAKIDKVAPRPQQLLQEEDENLIGNSLSKSDSVVIQKDVKLEEQDTQAEGAENVQLKKNGDNAPIMKKTTIELQNGSKIDIEIDTREYPCEESIQIDIIMAELEKHKDEFGGAPHFKDGKVTLNEEFKRVMGRNVENLANNARRGGWAGFRAKLIAKLNGIETNNTKYEALSLFCLNLKKIAVHKQAIIDAFAKGFRQGQGALSALTHLTGHLASGMRVKDEALEYLIMTIDSFKMSQNDPKKLANFFETLGSGACLESRYRDMYDLYSKLLPTNNNNLGGLPAFFDGTHKDLVIDGDIANDDSNIVNGTHNLVQLVSRRYNVLDQSNPQITKDGGKWSWDKQVKPFLQQEIKSYSERYPDAEFAKVKVTDELFDELKKTFETDYWVEFEETEVQP